MKRIIGLLILAVFLLGASMAQAKEKEYLIDGHAWQASSQAEKISFITGMDGAIAIDFAIDKRREEKAIAEGVSKKKRLPSVVSPYDAAWMEVFANKKNSEVVTLIDEYYTAHPEGLNRNVMEVIWYELLAPNCNRGDKK